MFKAQYSGTRVEAWADGQLVVAAVTGIVSPSVAGQIIGQSPLWAPDPAVQVVDYVNADLRIDCVELFSSAVLAKPADIPTALIVPLDRLLMMREYCQMHLARGVLKQAFTNAEEAHRWARRQAAVLDYWSRAGRSLR